MQVRRRPASGGEDDTEQTTRLLHASSLQSASVTDFAFCWACGHSMIDSSICEETAVHRGVVTQLYACAHCQAIGYKMGGSAPSGPASKGGSVLRHVVASLVWILASMITAVGLFYVLPWTVKNPQLPDMYRVPLPWVSYALAGMTFWHLTMVYCGTSWYQPPQLLRGNPLRRDVAAGQFSGMRWCYRCEHARPSMVHHCSQCGKCVVGMDHHCAFLGTCVAKRNHGAFFSFLAATTVSCGFVAAVLYRALRMTRMLNGMYVGGLVGLLPERVTGRAPSSTVVRTSERANAHCCVWLIAPRVFRRAHCCMN